MFKVRNKKTYNKVVRVRRTVSPIVVEKVKETPRLTKVLKNLETAEKKMEETKVIPVEETVPETVTNVPQVEETVKSNEVIEDTEVLDTTVEKPKRKPRKKPTEEKKDEE